MGTSRRCALGGVLRAAALLLAALNVASARSPVVRIPVPKLRGDRNSVYGSQSFPVPDLPVGKPATLLNRNDRIDLLVRLGYEKNEATQALEQQNWDVDNAADYLSTVTNPMRMPVGCVVKEMCFGLRETHAILRRLELSANGNYNPLYWQQRDARELGPKIARGIRSLVEEDAHTRRRVPMAWELPRIF